MNSQHDSAKNAGGRSSIVFSFAGVLNWLKVNGPQFSPFQLREKYESYFFDRKHGTETKTDVSLSSLQIDSENKKRGHRYHASPCYSLRMVLKNLDIDHADYSFIDFGSGKGRALLVASGLPFKSIIGVEFSRELNECAAKNVAAFQCSSPHRVVLVHGDAAKYRIPDDKLVIYFFNPFHLPVLSQVLGNISESLAGNLRPVILIFLCLENKELLDGLTAFKPKATWRRYHIYEFTPEPADRSAVA